jgi:predicted site-specific integrase-resolvase
MKYLSQGRVAEITGLSLITIWRYCRKGKIKTTIVEIYQKGGKLVQTPLIPETELKKLGY